MSVCGYVDTAARDNFSILLGIGWSRSMQSLNVPDAARYRVSVILRGQAVQLGLNRVLGGQLHNTGC